MKAVGALILLAFLLPAPAAGAAAPCYGKQRGKSREGIARSADIRVYRSRPKGFEDWTYLACDRRTGRVMRLGSDGISDGPRAFKVAGRFVAYVGWEFNRCCSDVHENVRLLDARARTIIGSWQYSAYNLSPRADLRHFRHHLGADGTYAFLIGTFNNRAGRYLDEATLEVVAASRVVDSGPDIDPASFSVVDGRVRWRRDGQAKSAPLVP
jgi:hypothetical protein